MHTPQQPHSNDLVLGNSAPVGSSAVLGGFAGVRQSLNSAQPLQRIAALKIIDRVYFSQGYPDLIQALHDRDLQVQKVAYGLLKQRSESEAQTALQDYPHYRLLEPIATLMGHSAPVKSVAFGLRQFQVRSAQSIALSADSVGMIMIWDLATGKVVEQLQTWTFAYGLSYDADRDWVIIRTAQSQLVAWSLKTFQEVNWHEDQTFQEEDLPTIRAISSTLTIDDRYLAFSNQRNIKIWDKQTAKEIAVLQGHRSLVNAINISDDRQYLLSGSEDKTVLVWGILDGS